MIPRTVNPYTLIGDQHVAGLDSIAAALTGTTPTLEIFVNTVYKYVQGIYYPTTPVPTQIETELKSLIGYAVNGYVNSVLCTDAGGYMTNTRQYFFVNKMRKSILHVPINEILDVLVDIEDNITRMEGLSTEEQVPLLLATQVGKKNIAYWLPKIATPGDWGSFFDANDAINTTNIPYWVASSIEGTLLLANRSAAYGLVNANSTPNSGVDIVSALSGSLAVGSSKVIFNIIRRITSEGSRDVGGCDGC